MDPTALAASAGQNILQSAFNAWQASKNRDFQERMSSTAHQREVTDLRKAGLNPILSARHGGASSPGGASAQAAGPDIARTGIEAQQSKAQIGLMNSQSALAQAQAGDVNMTQQQRIDLLIAQKRLALQSADATDYGKLKTEQEIKNLEAQKQLINQQTLSTGFDASKKEVQSKLWDIPRKILKQSENIRPRNPSGHPGRVKETFNKNTWKKVFER